MSKTVLANVEGFTPCIDTITQELGVMPSIVFGRVWRYCQGKRGVCDAAIETIAADLSISYNTVRIHINTLVEHGYLADLTPTLRNHPHTYADTGKAGLVISVSAAPQNLRSHSSEIEEPTPQNLTKKKAVKKEVKKEEGASARSPVRVPASGKKKDPLLSHPAIIAYHDAARRHVPVVWREQVARTVGDTPPQVERWKKLVIDWCGSGWNAGNVKGMLERFTNPGPAQRGAARTSQPITISSLGLRGADE